MGDDWRSIPGNEHAFERLRDALASGEAIGFVGAGASAGLYPLWTGLIRLLAQEAFDHGLASAEDRTFWLDPNTKPQQAVRGIKQALGYGTYAEILRNRFAPRKGADGNSFTPVHGRLAELPFRGLVTTNYDSGLLEALKQVRPASVAAGAGFATWRDGDAVNRWLTGKVFAAGACPILFAHGYYDRGDTIVLGADEYRDAYRPDQPSTQLMKTLWAQNQLVFVGFGFSDPWLDFMAETAIGSAGARTAAAPRHFAVTGLSKPYTKTMRALFRAQYNADPVFYPVTIDAEGSEDFSGLLDVLQALASERRRAPLVYISYSHESSEHEKRVLALADRLRMSGIDAVLDQYEESPLEGWPAWCEKQIEAADFVLMICTEIYNRRVTGKEEPGIGLGVVWESQIIYQQMYEAGGVRTKFVPVIFSEHSTAYIPIILRGSTYFVVDSQRGFDRLCKLLYNQPLASKPHLILAQAGSTSLRRKKETSDSRYYVRTRGGPGPLHEAKIILVGYGGVGKTSVVNKLVYSSFDRSSPVTEGVSITEWSITLSSKEKIRLHIWDFGGQEIMHATHQFFLTQNALYILVLSGREGREDSDAEYWLNIIGALSAESRVIVLLNKCKQISFDVNRRALQHKFPNVCAFIESDCEDGSGFDLLKQQVHREIDRLPNVRDMFPLAWFSIKDGLASMQENYLSFERYRAFCAEHGESDELAQEKLAAYLHRLGIAINYRDDPRLQDTHVLNPHWVTDGIYSILLSKNLTHKKGELILDDLVQILDQKRYPRERHHFILELMRKFELCFRFPEHDDRYLIPQLLDKQEPEEARSFDEERCLIFEFHYPTLLPEGLLPRLIVRTYVLSNGQPRWRTGVILRFEGNRALVKGDPVDRRIRVLVDGPAAGRRRLLAVIRSDFERIHASYKFRPEGMLPVLGHSAVRIPYAKLLVLERNGIARCQEVVGDEVLELDVKELLDGVDLERTRPEVAKLEQPRRALRAFVSYAHEDDVLRAELETHLKLLRRQGLLHVWTDRLISAGSEWKERIDANLEGADLVLLLISSDFIASDYCYDKEMVRAMQLHEANTARIIPIIVRDCKWHSAPFGSLQALPADGKAVTAWGPDKFARDKAWTSVAEGIETALDELRARQR